MIVSATGAVLLMIAACLGLGAAALRGLGLLGDMARDERFAWSFAVGLGALGWLVFFAGVAGRIGGIDLFVLCAASTAGAVFLRPGAAAPRPAAALDGIGRLLCALILVVLAYDLLEGLAPPSDADSLAYHFALPKQFLAAGRLEFVPRAIDGAAPLLVQMTYLAALGLGGEAALMLWTMASGWMAAFLLYGLCRRHIGVNWSLAVALIWLSTPAVLQGGGGMVETRLALFALTGAVAAGRAIRAGDARYAALAGLAAGFYIGAKFTGVFFAIGAALCLLLGSRGRIMRLAAFAAAAIVAGSQWYGWNWAHTGDPVFPLLQAALGYPDSAIWTAQQDAIFHDMLIASENPLPRTPFWLLAYPFHTTLGGTPALEAGRTGLGPFVLMVLPFAAAGAWRYRERITASPLAVPALIAVLYYVIWFFSGTSQRIRHLLPLYPILLLCAVTAAARWAATPGRRRPLAAAAAITIAAQLAGTAVYGRTFVHHALSGETRGEFLARNVTFYAPVPWINANLTQQDRVLVNERQLLYLLTVPTFMYHPAIQALVTFRRGSTDRAALLRQLEAQGITHLLVVSAAAEDTGARADGRLDLIKAMANLLTSGGCAKVVRRFRADMFTSRTLPALGRRTRPVRLLAITRDGCRP